MRENCNFVGSVAYFYSATNFNSVNKMDNYFLPVVLIFVFYILRLEYDVRSRKKKM